MPLESAKIIILEDEALTSQLYKMIVKSMEHIVSGIVDRGEDLINSVDSSLPDLIISDIKVKGELSGLAAIGEIKKRYKIPVIFITALSDPQTLQKMKDLTPCGILIKPVFPKVVKDTITNCLQGH